MSLRKSLLDIAHASMMIGIAGWGGYGVFISGYNYYSKFIPKREPSGCNYSRVQGIEFYNQEIN